MLSSFFYCFDYKIVTMSTQNDSDYVKAHKMKVLLTTGLSQTTLQRQASLSLVRVLSNPLLLG